MNSPCFEQTRLSREATAAQKKLERPLKPQAVKSSASTNCLQRMITSRGHCSPKETRAGHCSQNTHSHLQPPSNEWKLITSRPLQPHFIREKKLYRWIKRRQFELVTIDKTKMIQFILRCQRTAPLCVNWYWHSETLRLDAPARNTCVKEVKADQQDQLSRNSFFSDSFTQIVAEQINK